MNVKKFPITLTRVYQPTIVFYILPKHLQLFIVCDWNPTDFYSFNNILPQTSHWYFSCMMTINNSPLQNTFDSSVRHVVKYVLPTPLLPGDPHDTIKSSR